MIEAVDESVTLFVWELQAHSNPLAVVNGKHHNALGECNFGNACINSDFVAEQVTLHLRILLSL